MTKQKLMSNRAKLEADIKIKNKSLKIDQHQCLSNRKTFPAITLTKNLWIGFITFLNIKCKIDTQQLKLIISIETFYNFSMKSFCNEDQILFHCTYWQGAHICYLFTNWIIIIWYFYTLLYIPYQYSNTWNIYCKCYSSDYWVGFCTID